MRTTLDVVVALITGLAWPAVAGAIAWWYRDPLSKFIVEVPRNIKSFKVAGVEVQLAEAKSLPLAVAEGAVDLRHAERPTTSTTARRRASTSRSKSPRARTMSSWISGPGRSGCPLASMSCQ